MKKDSNRKKVDGILIDRFGKPYKMGCKEGFWEEHAYILPDPNEVI